MKQNKLLPVVISASVLAILGLFIYTKLNSGNQKATVVEVIDPIKAGFNQEALTALSDPRITKDFAPDIPLDDLGNERPFGPLR